MLNSSYFSVYGHEFGKEVDVCCCQPCQPNSEQVLELLYFFALLLILDDRENIFWKEFHLVNVQSIRVQVN